MASCRNTALGAQRDTVTHRLPPAPGTRLGAFPGFPGHELHRAQLQPHARNSRVGGLTLRKSERGWMWGRSLQRGRGHMEVTRVALSPEG